MESKVIEVRVNKARILRTVRAEQTLAGFLREDLELPGTQMACGEGQCGSCTVLLDGQPIRSCLMLAIQAEGYEVTTVEGLAEDSLNPLQSAFRSHHALQCGFCTAGILMTATALLDGGAATEFQVREAIRGHLCRCTGYAGIVEAILECQRAPAPQL
jgi:aerobic-type carbon monoxide dehydrogenase small subunit (CoxS/CutS family)